MKKDTPLVISWKEIIPAYRKVSEMTGYSTPEQIAEKSGLTHSSVNKQLRLARTQGKVTAQQARSDTGQLVWMYKD
jgi:hypothetical protein